MRWRRRRRFWRRRGRYWRRYPRRRIRKARRFTRRGTVRARRRRRRGGRRMRVQRFWDPASKKNCSITGWTTGLQMTATSQIPYRMLSVNVSDWGNPNRYTIFQGGGVALNVFSLAFLWQEHQLFRNFWSNSNDGFDLARYIKTTIYLPPHKDNTYIFWWDEDFNQLKRSDYWKTQPSLLLAYKNKRIIRPQKQGNYKTQKVVIRPPATVSNQWRFQGSWMTMGLFMWGITVMDWNLPFSAPQDSSTPLSVIKLKAYISRSPGQFEFADFYYAFFVDTGQDNFVMAKTVPSAEPWMTSPGQSNMPPANANLGMFRVEGADDLPYWMTFWGQNSNWDFDDPSDRMLNATGYALIYWWRFNEGDIEKQNFRGKQKVQWLLSPNNLYRVACSGPFVNRTNVQELNIPILYRSKWQWGGATLNKQAIQPYIHFAPKQVAVRNPATIERSIITPWDTDRHGILTEEALQRFLRPSREVDARRPLPIEEDSEDDEPYTSSAEESEIAEEDEKGPQNEQELKSLIRRCRARILREQHERHRLRRFLRGLIPTPLVNNKHE
nr:MAG: ORF1 [Torque teno felis virus]